jgi:Meiotically up-regulated gene 113
MRHSTTQVQRQAAIEKRQALGHWIYGISDGACLKVGYAMDVDRRLRELQTASPRDLVVVYRWRVTQWKRAHAEIVSAKNWERWYHAKLREFHLRGEWFRAEALPVLLELNAPE